MGTATIVVGRDTGPNIFVVPAKLSVVSGNHDDSPSVYIGIEPGTTDVYQVTGGGPAARAATAGECAGWRIAGVWNCWRNCGIDCVRDGVSICAGRNDLRGVGHLSGKTDDGGRIAEENVAATGKFVWGFVL